MVRRHLVFVCLALFWLLLGAGVHPVFAACDFPSLNVTLDAFGVINVDHPAVHCDTLIPVTIMITEFDQNGGHPLAVTYDEGPLPILVNGTPIYLSNVIGVVCCGGASQVLPVTFATAGRYLLTAHGNFPVAPVEFVVMIGGLAAPANLQATQIGNDGAQIQLTWDYGSDPIDGFAIQRKTPNGPWQTMPQQAGAADRTFTDTVSTAYATYSYQIQAFQASSTSNYSNTATAYQLKGLLLYGGTTIQALFTPDPTVASAEVSAHALGFDHFNWISIVNHDPECYINNASTWLHAWNTTSLGPPFPSPGAAQFAPHLDPPLGGYVEYGLFPGSDGPSDGLAFFWDEQQPWYLDPLYSLNFAGGLSGPLAGGPQGVFGTVQFIDQPKMQCLPGNTPTQASEYLGFYTTLVGVSTSIGGHQLSTPPWYLTKYMPLTSFSWNTSFNESSGGIRTLNVNPSPGQGSGGIFNVARVDINSLPLSVRQLLIQSGAQGVSTAPYVDTNAPMTAAFLLGHQGTNGWYTGSVSITLIATDIDGPSDIASTTYSIDGGSANGYFSAITVAGDGSHTIQFGSVDRAGNVEMPRPLQSFGIDATPPSIVCNANPTTLWPPNGKPVVVNVSGSITDATSGLDSSTVKFTVTDDYGQVQPSGAVAAEEGGSYSFGVSLIADRDGSNKDARTYKIAITAKDKAGNLGSCSTVANVPHDQRR